VINPERVWRLTLLDINYVSARYYLWFSISLRISSSTIFSLAAKIALIHFETPEIAKMLHNIYKGLCIGKYHLRTPFTVDLPY
jgi:hypothetical protein